ncbi:MFS transporter [Corynebacterium sputi]|uniref:MFS transporter n=1 Tax=Corynebacterium sputi TaxID=489915 RepID=UPI000687C9CD|nr:MFS transporter [Corynebacterium sputi]
MTSPTEERGKGQRSLQLAPPRERRKVLTGTLVGTTIEWFDFFIYAQVAAVVLGPLFFSGLENQQIVAWASLGVSFLFRPLGAFIGGHVGDRYGRKMVLVFSLVGMGAATFLIGLLPTYATIGVAAPLLLLLLRILQGVSAGAEWGGAALMSVESAPDHKRGFYGSFPQLGVPLGLLLASAVTLTVRASLGAEAYEEWGWRIPFIGSILLVGIGYAIRVAVDESPVFRAMQAEAKEETTPLGSLFRDHWRTIIKAIFIFAGNNATGYMIIAFFTAYSRDQLGLDGNVALTTQLVAASFWTLFTLLSGIWSDKYGRIKIFLIGFVLQAIWVIGMWPFIDKGDPVFYMLAVVILTLPLALTYGPTSSLFAEMFPAKVRVSGASISYALGSIVGGAFAPMIAQLILNETGQGWPIGIYLALMCVPAVISLLLLPRDIHKRSLLD